MNEDTVTGQRETEMILVPRIPTPEMLRAGWYGAHIEDAAETWRMMIEECEAQKKGTTILED